MAKKTKAGPGEEKDVLTASEVAGWLRIPKSTLYKLAQERRIPAKKIGRHWRFERTLICGMATRPHDKERRPIMSPTPS